MPFYASQIGAKKKLCAGLTPILYEFEKDLPPLFIQMLKTKQKSKKMSLSP